MKARPGYAKFEVAEPGWSMFMVSHFHYDPVWWNTQAAYTETWELSGQPWERAFQQPGSEAPRHAPSRR
jgi:hypothetical protein